MDLMREFPDKHFELAIVDPPYGIGEALSAGGDKGSWGKMIHMNATKWDSAPSQKAIAHTSFANSFG